MGFDNNCDFIHALIRDAIVGEASSLSRVLLVPNMGHVIASTPGPHQEEIEAWLADILAVQPEAPVFP